MLILLALYDADAGASQSAGPELGRAELYERLLVDCAGHVRPARPGHHRREP